MSLAVYHLDSNVLVDYLRGKSPQVQKRLGAVDRANLRVSVVVVGELRVAAEKRGDAQIFDEIHAALLGVGREEISEVIAEKYAEIRAVLESKGEKMDTNDLWIAASALVQGAILVTADEAFGRILGLKTENWRLGE